MSLIPTMLRKRLLLVALLSGGVVAGGIGYQQSQTLPSQAVMLAQTLGAFYEGYRLTPYQDTGGVWTVCAGITGNVDPQKIYTTDECASLEQQRYAQAEAEATRLFVHWDTYNIYVRASLIDMLFNLGAAQVARSTLLTLANQGDITAACAQMPRWVWGKTSNGLQRLPGLVKRRNTTAELCEQWGRTGHFSEAVL